MYTNMQSYKNTHTYNLHTYMYTYIRYYLKQILQKFNNKYNPINIYLINLSSLTITITTYSRSLT